MNHTYHIKSNDGTRINVFMFSYEHAPQLSNTASKVQWSLRFAFSYRVCSAHYTALQTKNSRSASATIQLPQKYDVSYALTINYCLESAAAITFHFPAMFSPVTQHYKQRTVLESSLQSIQSPQKIQMIPVYKHTVGKPCIVLP